MKKNILGVKIDDLTMAEALDTVHQWLPQKKKHYIVTPNPEIIMLAQKDIRYKSILNDADLSIPDGIGLKLSGQVKNTFAGVDFMEELIKKSIDWAVTVGFLGGAKGIAEKAAERLREKYPGVKIIFAESGGEVDKEGNSIAYSVESIAGKKQNKTKPHHTPYVIPHTDLLFVAFGPPKQEKWISNNLDKIPVKIAIGVGGAFDYISGNVPRAQKWIRRLGFEWLFRLVIQPWRIKRQLSLIKYLWLIWTVDDRK